MSEKEFNCKNCGAPLANYAQAEVIRCKYCGTAFGEEGAGVEVLKEETPSHQFKEAEPVKVTEFQKRTLRFAFDTVAGKLVNRLVAACMPYLILILLVIAGLIAAFIWVIYMVFA